MSFSKRLKSINIDFIMYGILIAFFLFMLFFSSFRDMINDETLYFHESWLMSEVFRSGNWIGNYAVGLHGFLFKLPSALIFLVTGPSITVVTVFNILLATLVGLIFYNLSKEILKRKILALLCTVLLLSTFHFFSSTPTYLREIPSLFAVLLFTYGLFKEWKKGYISLIFLLLLDSKEYVFFVFALFYLIWLFVNSKEKGFRKVLSVLKQYFLVLLPSILWIILMFCTAVIPMNMYLASTIGLIDGNFRYLFSHFSVDLATLNLIEGGKDMPLIAVQGSWSVGIRSIVAILNTILLYIGKILYPRTFSFVSVPKVVMFPVIFTSFLYIKKYLRTKKKDLKIYASLSILLLVWLAIYLLRASHGRYLLPVVPAISILYINMLFNSSFNKKQLSTVFVGTLLFMTLGFFFETSYVLPKILVELLIYVIFVLTILKPKKDYLKYILISLIAAVCIGVSILFAYTQGQVYGYINWGKNRNAQEIVKVLPQQERYWSNNDENQLLLSVYSKETYSPVQWKWKLHKIVPRTQRLKVIGEQRSFVFPVISIDEFKENLKTYSITKMVLFESTIENREFMDQEYLNVFLNQDWIQLDQRYIFKGMNVYIFNIVWKE